MIKCEFIEVNSVYNQDSGLPEYSKDLNKSLIAFQMNNPDAQILSVQVVTTGTHTVSISHLAFFYSKPGKPE